ncbi:hypothetical protein ACEQ8H_007881 [Pleosporales sp. CAS-2024a]
MWVPGNRVAPHVQRTPSVHSVGSVHSPSQSRSPSTAGLSRTSTTVTPHEVKPPQYQTAPLHIKTGAAPSYSSQPAPKDKWDIATEDDVSSRSSTLDGDEEYMDHVEKKPPVALGMLARKGLMRNEEPRSPNPAPHVPGPLESQLAALMSKLIYMEQANPAMSVRPEEFQDMQNRLKTLEEEKKAWTRRHEAIWALRDEDVENNIKIRGMLAKARRDLEAMTKLRDEDLHNVLVVRAKLADKTREVERLSAAQAQTGRMSPSRGRPASYVLERRDTSDLFVAAKTAALEQRTLELEKRNSDLVAQIEALKSGSSSSSGSSGGSSNNIDELNRVTAHQAWKSTVAELQAQLQIKDAELARLQSGSASASAGTGGARTGMDWYKVEALLEEHAHYRESVGGKLQALRCDKEALQKELHRKENDYQVLELRYQTLQRRSTVL